MKSRTLKEFLMRLDKILVGSAVAVTLSTAAIARDYISIKSAGRLGLCTVTAAGISSGFDGSS